MREVLLERTRKPGEPRIRFPVEIDLTNDRDVTLASAGVLAADKVRRARIRGLVDTLATDLVLPVSVAAALGLEEKEEVVVCYGDERRGVGTDVRYVEVNLLGRDGVFSAIAEPDRKEALIGTIVLDSLDLVVNSREQRLEPRDPRGRTASLGGDFEPRII